MTIPLTKACPQCEGEMELLTADDTGEVVVYECPDCGYQVENRVDDSEEESLGRQDLNGVLPTGGDDDADAGGPEPIDES
ncbi:MAG TPA: hypothetical protein VEW91_04525 [bacterium]|nr:hypothetical protein [bacterium]